MMRKLETVARFAALTSALGALATACGGNSFSSGHSNGATDTGGAFSMAGASNVAGKAPQGGNGSGGSTTAGSSNGGESSSGTSSGGATSDEACRGPASEHGSCTAAFRWWTHDAERGICVPTLYGGCGRTKNLYETLADCQAACSDSTPSYDACEVSTDCALGSPGCCGVCEGPSITTHDFVAYNRNYAANVNTCGDVACGACPNPEGDPTLRYFFPNCVAGRCVVEDLRTSSISACKTDDDCIVRPGRNCCSSCDDNRDDMFAVRNDGSFENLVCGDQRLPCPPCLPAHIGNAVCGNDGHCLMAYTAD
ncbi:MAG TPA: BPTI/Kunitz domain-containing protein [Polyangiaceae bacterium]|nr:BPTI/Kunitz domain-containing protein [Polyangiaceae bacterium]